MGSCVLSCPLRALALPGTQWGFCHIAKGPFSWVPSSPAPHLQLPAALGPSLPPKGPCLSFLLHGQLDGATGTRSQHWINSTGKAQKAESQEARSCLKDTVAGPKPTSVCLFVITDGSHQQQQQLTHSACKSWVWRAESMPRTLYLDCKLPSPLSRPGIHWEAFQHLIKQDKRKPQ